MAGYAGYGLYRGLNEAYDAYRGREAQILDEETRAKEQAYRDTQRQRETEQYEYQKGVMRPLQEESAKLGLESGKVGLEKSKLSLEDLEKSQKDKWAPDAVLRRRQMAEAELKKLETDLERSGILLNQAQFQQDEDKLKRYYEDLAKKWEKGMSLDELITSFNEDDDIESNNIVREETRKNPDGTYTVKYQDGRTEMYEDSDDVLKTLYMMSDSTFAKNVLMNELKGKADLAAKMAKLRQDAMADFQARGEKFTDDARAEVQALLGTVLPNGITDFGEPGMKELGQEIRAMVLEQARLYGFDLTKTSAPELTAAIAKLARKTMDTSPENRNKRALELYEKMGVPDVQRVLGDDKITEVPEKGDPMYDALIRQLKFQQAMGDVNALRDTVRSHFAMVDQQGNVVQKQTIAPKGVIPGEESLMSGDVSPTEAEAASRALIDDPETGWGVKRKPIGPASAGADAERMPDMSDFKQSMRKEIGIVTGRATGKKGRKHEANIQKYYVDNYADMNVNEKKAFLEEYGNKLPSTLLAEAKAQLGRDERNGLQVARKPRI